MRTAAMAAGIAIALLLTGCSTPTISGGTGGSGGSGGSGEGTSGGGDDTGSGSGDESGDDTGAGSGGAPLTGRLPADWPAEVVVAEGEIVSALSMGDSGWVALINAADPATAFTETSKSLQAAGFTVTTEIVTDHGAVGSYQNDQYLVQVSVPDAAESGWTMSYTVTKK